MPVPTGVAARELQNSVTTNSDHQWPTENGDEYYASYSSSMEQDIGLCTSFSENTVVIQVNPGEVFTIQNEDGSCRNIPGPAQVPMISQNGNIPPIFVPPGYVSHVIEENGIRRVIVVPSTNTSNVTDNQTVLCSPTFNHPTIHHPSFHHFGFPVNGIHSPYHNGYFSHPHVYPNCRPETVHYMQRQPLYIQDGSRACANPECAYYCGTCTAEASGQSVSPSFLQCSHPSSLERSNSDRALSSSSGNACAGDLPAASPQSKDLPSTSVHMGDSPNTPFTTGDSPHLHHQCAAAQPSQFRVLRCTYSPHSERGLQTQSPALDRKRTREVEAPVRSRTQGTQVNMLVANAEKERENSLAGRISSRKYSSDSAYSSFPHSCVSETPPLASSSCASLQSCTMECHPDTCEKFEAIPPSSGSPPGTSSMTSSPDSTSSMTSSLQDSPTGPGGLLQEKRRETGATMPRLCDFNPALPDAHLDNFSFCVQKANCIDTELQNRGAEDVEHQHLSQTSNGFANSTFSTLQSLLSSLSKPEVHKVRPRSTHVVWSSLPIHKASSSVAEKLSECAILFDLHLSKADEGKFQSIYKGTNLKCAVYDLKPATTYGIRLYAVCGCEKGLPSDVTVFRTPPSRPDPPPCPKLLLKSQNTLTLKWDASCDNGEKIQRYLVEVSDTQHPNAVFSRYPCTQKQFRVPKLMPLHEYTFRLAAENAIGKSPWSSKVCYTTSPSTPLAPDPPQFKKATASNITLMWPKPSTEVTGFILEMASDTNGQRFHPVYDGSDRVCTVESLEKQTKYNFRLQAYVEEEKSPYSDVISYSTTSDKRLAAIKPMLVGKASSKSFKITWDCPENVLNTKVRYVLEMSRGRNTMREVYKGPEREYAMDEVQPGCSYNFQLYYVSSGERSFTSDVLTVETPSVAPGACLAPVLSLRQSRSLRIKWGPPHHNGGAHVSDYELNCIPDQKEAFQAYKGSDTECSINNLQPGTKYSICVRAENKNGVGPWSERLDTRTSASVPGKPETPKATVLSSTCVHLQWDPPSNNGADISNYRLYWGTDKASMSPFSKGPIHVYEMKSLNPSTTYYYSIKAVNSVGDGPVSDIGTARTFSSIPGPVIGLTLDGPLSTSVSTTWIKILWNPPCDNGSEITGYRILWQPELPEENESIHPSAFETEKTITSYCIENCVPGTNYSIKVCAFNALNLGCFCSPLSVHTKSLPPLPPRLFCADATSNSLTLKLEDRSKVTPDTKYLLQMQKKHGKFMDCHGKSQNCYRITNLTENRPYIFRIRSSDSNGDGEFSNEQTFYTNPKKPPTMEAPIVCDVTAMSCRVSWQRVNEIKKDAISYHLQLRDENKVLLDKFKCTGTQYLLTGLASNSYYKLSVYAVRHCATPRYLASNSVSATDSSDRNLNGPMSSLTSFHTLNGDHVFAVPTLTPCADLSPKINDVYSDKKSNTTELSNGDANAIVMARGPMRFTLQSEIVLLGLFMGSALLVAFLVQLFYV